MISKLFLLLVVILIVLGLYCSDKPVKLEQFSTNTTTGDKHKLINNEYAHPKNLNEGGLSVDQNDVEHYDPEDKYVSGADYTSCNNSHQNINGCVSNYERNKASHLRKDATIEMYANSSTDDISDGASQIYNRGLPSNSNIEHPPDPRPPGPPHPRPPRPPGPRPPRPPGPRPPRPVPCHRCSNKECRNCDILLNKDIDKYVLKSSIPPRPDMREYAKKSMLCPCRDMSKYILKRNIPKCPECRRCTKCPSCPRCPRCPECPECPKIDLDKYITRKECNRLRTEDKKLWSKSVIKQKININESSRVVNKTNINKTNINKTNINKTNINKTNINKTNINKTNINNNQIIPNWKNRRKDTRFKDHRNEPFNHDKGKCRGYSASGDFNR